VDKLIPRMYKTYGIYVNSFRSFPLKDDGCKPIERRVLLSAYEIARDKLVKSARIDGHVIGHYSPHGTSYGTIVQLARQGFLTPQGNFGNNLGVDPSPPAAMRYTEAKLSSLGLNNSFRLINYIDRQESELDPEPPFLPSMFPVCLLGKEYTQGIGFGYRTFIPCYKLEDLHKRLLWLLKIEKDEPIIKPICDSIITSDDNTLKQLLTTGKATLSTQGIIVEQQTSCKVVVKSWPEGRRFESVMKKFQKEFDNGDIGISDLSNEENGNYIQFEVLKQRNRDKIYLDFLKKLKAALKGTISFEVIIVTKEGKVELCSIDNFLLHCFNNFKTINEVMLKTELIKLDEKIQENKDLEKLREPLRIIMAVQKVPVNESYGQLTKDSGLPIERVKDLLSKYRISKLLTMDTDITKLIESKKELEEHLNKLHDFVLDRYKEI